MGPHHNALASLKCPGQAGLRKKKKRRNGRSWGLIGPERVSRRLPLSLLPAFTFVSRSIRNLKPGPAQPPQSDCNAVTLATLRRCAQAGQPDIRISLCLRHYLERLECWHAECWNARKTWNRVVHDKPSRPLQRVAAAESPLHVHLHTTPPAIAIDIARPPVRPSSRPIPQRRHPCRCVDVTISCIRGRLVCGV